MLEPSRSVAFTCEFVMQASEALLESAEAFIYEHTGVYLSDLQRVILLEALSNSPKRKTYEQIAAEAGYSPTYVGQVVGPQVWQILSEAMGEKVTKSSARAVLLQKLQIAKQADTKAAMELPAMRSHPSLPPDSAPSSDPAPTNRAKVPKAVILLVDDQPRNLALLSDMLENEGYGVRQALNGAIALRAVSVAPPDLILLDVNMPEMDGYEVCRRLKADSHTQSIPVIFVSALHEVWDKVQAFSVGGGDYITKPFKVIEVIARIENQLEFQRSQRQRSLLAAQLQYANRVLQAVGVLDAVLGLVNRNFFDTALQSVWEQGVRSHSPLSLILCRFNSPQPPEALDWSPIVQTVLSTVQYPNALVASYGAHTVAVLLPNVKASQGKALAWKLNAALTAHVKSMGLLITVGGVSQVPAADTPIRDLIEKSENVLRSATQEQSGPVFQAFLEGA